MPTTLAYTRRGSSSAHLGGAGFAWDASSWSGIGAGVNFCHLLVSLGVGGMLFRYRGEVAPRVYRTLKEDGCGKRRIPAKVPGG